MSIFCKNCGIVVKEGNKFCTNCGTEINTSNNNVQNEKNTTKESFTNTEIYKENKGWALYYIILFLIIIIIVSVLPNKETTEKVQLSPASILHNKLEQEIKNESTYSSKIQNNDTISNNTNVKKSNVLSNDVNTTISKIDTNNVENKWKYKDWEIENIDDNFIKASTVGKNRADIFTIIKKKNDCNPSFLYTTTHLFDKSIQVNKGDILKMDIKVDNELFNSDTKIYEIYNLGFVKQLMSTPYPLYESFIEKLKKANTVQTTIISPILKDIDTTPNEDYSLNGFTKAYNVLNEACRDISALNRYKEVDKNTINQYVSTNNDKMFLIESIECNGKRVKLMSNDEYFLNEGLLLLDNGKSIRFQDMNIDGDISSRLECKKVKGKSYLIIASTMGNSWSGHYSINLDTLTADLLDNETEIKLGLKEKPIIDKIEIIINKKSYIVPKHPYSFAENNGFINFKDLLGTDYETFLWNLQVGSTIENIGQYYVGTGNGKSSGGMYEAIFTIDKFTGKTSVSILTTDLNNHKKNFKYFGEITPPIDEWVNDLQKTE